VITRIQCMTIWYSWFTLYY